MTAALKPHNIRQMTILVLGATGGTGKHFVNLALTEGHKVRALVRDPAKLPQPLNDNLEIRQGSITGKDVDTDSLVKGVTHVVAMVGDKEAQRTEKIVTAFIRKLVPSMREHGVKTILYQAGGFSKPYGGELSWILWILRNTMARGAGFEGQHKDNEAVMEYLATEGNDLIWMVHRAGIGSDGPSKGTLRRSASNFSIANHIDCAAYNLKLLTDDSAIRTADFSSYGR